MGKPVNFRLNGSEVSAVAGDGQNLLDFLRRSVGDLSPKFGCAQGGCGACSVIIDGSLMLSCLTLAETADGCDIQTAAGLADGPALHPLQTAFMESFAAQCGYCTPGMLMAAKALLDRNPAPSREDIVEAVSGNLCRCTGYEPIIDAVVKASPGIRGGDL